MVVAMLLLMFLLTDDGFGGDFIPSPPATIRVVLGQSIALALKVSNENREKVHVHVHTNIPDTYGFGELLYPPSCCCSFNMQDSVTWSTFM